MIKTQNLKLFIVLLFCIVMLDCSGVKKTIQSAQAFSMIVQKGAAQGSGLETDIPLIAERVISIYVRASSCVLEFDTCWIKNKPYPLQVQKIIYPLEIGIDENSGQKITIMPSENDCLYQLQLAPLTIAKEELTELSIHIRLMHKQKSAFQTVVPVQNIISFDNQ